MRIRSAAAVVAAAATVAVLAPTAAHASYRDICLHVDERNLTWAITTTTGFDPGAVNPVDACVPW